MTLQAISIVNEGSQYISNALFAINAAESSNLFWMKINVMRQNQCLQMFKQTRLIAGLVCSVGSQPDDCED